MELTVGDVAGMTGAGVTDVDGAAVSAAMRGRRFRAVAVDSRRVGPEDLFVALPGQRTDGSRFVGDAYARGALAALTCHDALPTPEQRSARVVAGAPPGAFAVLRVPDTLAALQRAAAAWRERHAGVAVIGVTGSVGKTTTREAIAGTLGRGMSVLGSPRSYNNEIGLPLTLLALERGHQAAVLEMGMYARGEIAALAALARPRIGVVTMVAPVHLERLGSIDAVAAAKAELVAALPADGLAVLNGDDARVRAMATLTPARAVTFGLGSENDWRAEDVCDRGLDGFSFTLRRGRWVSRVQTRIVGRHFVHALLAAAAVAEALGMPPDDIAAALGEVAIGERQRFLHGPSDLLIIDDSWNASVPSMLAALDVLAATPRRHVAILGEMLELGDISDEAHRTVGRRAGEVVAALLTIGMGGAIMAAEARRAGGPITVVHVDAPDQVPTAAAGLLRSGDAVLVKGSRGLHLEETVSWLLEGRP